MIIESFDFGSSLIIVFLMLLFVAFLLSKKVDHKTSNYLLAAFICLNIPDIGINLLDSFLVPDHFGLRFFLNSTIFLAVPTLYLYVLSVIYTDFKLNRHFLWHCIPFIMVNLIFIPRIYSVGAEAHLLFFQENEANRTLEFLISDIIIQMQFVFYFVISIMAIRKYKVLLLENYSNAKIFNYKWLFQLITLFYIILFVASIKNLFRVLEFSQFYQFCHTLTNVFFLGFFSWLVLRAMHSPELFKGIDSKLQLAKTFVLEDNELPQNSELSSVKIAEEELQRTNRLQKYMVEKEPYLDPELTIQDLSKQSSIPIRELSLIINRNLNQHFFDFINGYRVKRTMDLLKSHTKKEFTIKEIYFEAGFNSKSTFYTAFKKYTLITPTAYRLKHLG